MKWKILLVAMLFVSTAYAAPATTAVAPSRAAATPASANDTVLTLERAIRTALKGSPGLQTIRARAQALTQVPSQQGALPDPNLSLRISNLPLDSLAVGQEAMTQLQLGFSQSVPFPGKLGLMSAVAEDQARMADYDVSEWRLQLVRDIRTLWWRLVYLDRAIGIVAANQDLLRQFVNIAQTKYRVGRGLQQDVLLAQLELSRLLERGLVLDNERRTTAIRLDTLMGLDIDQAVRLPEPIDEDLPDVSALAQVLAEARQARPALQREDAAIEAAESRLDLARKDYYPDLVLSAGYGFRSGSNIDGSSRPDLLSLGASISLPVFAGARQDRRLDQRQGELLAQRFQRSDVRRRIEAEITEAFQDYQLARERIRLFRQGIIPQAMQTVASMRSGYEVSKIDFLNLIRAQITLFDYQIRYWQTLSQSHEALARLTAAIGKETYDEYE